ncbi:arrestin domain-containing protein 3-like [Mugil cephalus]|uniref:arrestin domain-containing protein 3-like n=1 Tax=Mugil cephalus TaxID=48193 RepID=UPI001FB6A00D|nr:arrestin domain-containing protein 3-like [Mugil cephalus]
MTNNVKSFSVGYNPINKSNIFSSGDHISGQITLELTADSNIEALSIKLKGKAQVRWTEHYGRTTVTYQNKHKYFSFQQFIIQKNQGNNIVRAGCNVYPFTFQIPAEELPSSFKGSFGKIRYTLEAVLSRSMRMDSKTKAEFTLIHKQNPGNDPVLMTPQRNMVDKKTNLFSSGAVAMDVNIARTGFRQGEGIQVVASIQNKSSRDIKPKYSLYSKYSYFAKGKRKVQTKNILKEVGDAIPPSAGVTVTRIITIPPITCVSVLNCDILKAEYRLKVYLDVKYASDPEIKFPIVVLPAVESVDEEGNLQLPDVPSYGYGAFSDSDMLGGTSFPYNPAASGPPPPPPYGTYDLYPPLTGFDKKS